MTGVQTCALPISGAAPRRLIQIYQKNLNGGKADGSYHHDIFEDKRCQNFIGTYSCSDNLKLIKGKKVFNAKLKPSDKEYIFYGLENVISDVFIDKIWNMIYERYKIYENL